MAHGLCCLGGGAARHGASTRAANGARHQAAVTAAEEAARKAAAASSLEIGKMRTQQDELRREADQVRLAARKAEGVAAPYVEARKQFETRQKQLQVWNALANNKDLVISGETDSDLNTLLLSDATRDDPATAAAALLCISSTSGPAARLIWRAGAESRTGPTASLILLQSSRPSPWRAVATPPPFLPA